MTDPFGTATLRESVLASWRSSPTRFREDANSEEDLFLGGYRDRLFIELAQNAADAAGRDGTLRVSIVDNELRVANTGEPLTTDGVTALASLRASAKQQGVGRFGVGFAAVLTVSDAPRILSTTGGVEFSAERTRAELGPEPAGRVPVLRLAWPTEDQPPQGFATEVRLPLSADIDAAALLGEFADQAVDVLLSLDGLTRIEIGADVWRRETANGWTDAWQDIHGPNGTSHWVIVRDHGELPADIILGAEARPQWTVCWALRVDDGRRPAPLQEDVLHAPTPTDERLSLPARLIATLPIEPSRRRVRPGRATDHVLEAAARTYADLVGYFGDQQRPAIVPPPRFPLSEVDEKLRALVLEQLRVTRWLRPAFDHKTRMLAPSEARLLPVPSFELADSVAAAIPGLVVAELAAPEYAPALAALDTVRLRLSDVVDAITGIDRTPAQWRTLYEALAKIVDNDPSAREELGALPVPLADGRTIPGPRGTLVADAELSNLDGVNAVHPDAVHPLLERLGARRGGPDELLESMAARVAHSLDDAESGLDVEPLVNTVLRLVNDAGVRSGEHSWLGALALRDTDGEWRRADELALPGSRFLALLDDDCPLGVLATDTAERWPAHVLAAVGVIDSFGLVVDESPTGPDHDLADEADWWDEQHEPPARMVAVRDLDLVADDAWPAAIRLLASEPDTWRALQDGYTAWWIGNHAVLAGAAPRDWRLPDAHDLEGLYDPIPELELDRTILAAIGVRGTLTVETTADAEELLARLGDPGRTIAPGVAQRAHAALADAVHNGHVDPAELDPPASVRTASGDVTDNGVVLDAPWLAPLTDEYATAGPDFALAEPLAELLDIPLATEDGQSAVESAGEFVRWADLGAVVDACDLIGVPVPDGGPIVHEQLIVGGRAAPWWVAEGIIHSEDSTAGLARALAWATDRWADRHMLAALLDDPENHLA